MPAFLRRVRGAVRPASVAERLAGRAGPFRVPFRDRRGPVLATVLFTLAAASGVMAKSLADVTLSRHVVAGGGGRSGSAGFTVHGTIGQSIHGTSAGPAARIVAGFWAPPSTGAATPPPTTLTPATPSATPTTGATAPPTASASPTPGGAGQWTVNTTDDLDDGRCDAAHCSLREALFAAHGHGGPDTIRFAIPSGTAGCSTGGVCTIRPTTRLPALGNGPTTLDGFTQPGAHPNTAPFGAALDAALRIVLDGGALPAGSYEPGLDVRGDGNVIRGLAIHGFYTGIDVGDAADNRFEGNFIGTDASGLAAPGNRCVGISVSGIEGGAGSRRNTIGGTTPAARNLISGNRCTGLTVGLGGGNLVLGNYIGTDASGSRGLPNLGGGVRVFRASGNRIGGPLPGEANLIAFNDLAGVIVDAGFGPTDRNTIRHNSIHSNTGPGIFLTGGANAGLAPPVIESVTTTRATGSACAGCTVELFSDTNGQGAHFEGDAQADDAGRWALDRAGGWRGPYLNATATDRDGNTSAFAVPVPLTGATATATASAGTPATRSPTPTARSSATPSPTPSASPPGPRYRIHLPWLAKEGVPGTG